MTDSAPLYNPVNPKKARKPKRSHPWSRWRPGWLRYGASKDVPAYRENK